MDVGIIVAVISGVCSFIGAYYSNQKQLAVLQERMDNLIAQVEKHNSVVERVYILEGKIDAIQK